MLDQGQNLAVGFTQSVSPRVVNELRVGLNMLTRDNAPQSAGTNQFAALGIDGPPLGAIDQGYPTLVAARLRDARRRSEPARARAGRGPRTWSTR